jgi:hypothetical protein
MVLLLELGRGRPRYSYNAGSGIVDGIGYLGVWVLVTAFDDSFQNTRGLYFRPFQLCLLERVIKTHALCTSVGVSLECLGLCYLMFKFGAGSWLFVFWFLGHGWIIGIYD